MEEPANLPRRARELLDRVLSLPIKDRAQFLDSKCAADAALRTEIESLLRAAEHSTSSDQQLATASLSTPVGPAADLTGQTLSHYRITERMGAGGMGTVYRGVDVNLNRAVAIKVISNGDASPQERLRFEREAKAASALNHPNIVTVYEVGRHGEIDFLAMERVNGQTLQQWADGRAMPLAEVLPLAIQMADALAAAHDAGIVHRDLKPANVMVTDRNVVKILDFGLAKQLAVPEVVEADTASGDNPELSRAGQILGTLYYMSPEQATGQAVDARSDTFAFGAVLYEMLTGRRAFQGRSPRSTIAAICNDEPKPLRSLRPDLPPAIETLIAGCLHKQPGDRWQRLTEVKHMLLDLASEDEAPVASRNAGRRWWWSAAAVAALALVWLIWPRSAKPARPVVNEAPRRATSQGSLWLDLSGDWRIHLQDRPEHASRDFDDQAWATHRLPRGDVYLFGTKYWLRRRVDLPGGTDRNQLALTLGVLHDVYEVYINGKLIGGTGSLDSFEHTLIPRARTFDIPPEAALGQGPLQIGLRARGALAHNPKWQLDDIGPYLLTYRDQAPPRDEGRRQLESRWLASSPDALFGGLGLVIGIVCLLAWRAERRPELLWLALTSFGETLSSFYTLAPLLDEISPYSSGGVRWGFWSQNFQVATFGECTLAAIGSRSRRLRLVLWAGWSAGLFALLSAYHALILRDAQGLWVFALVLPVLLKNWYGLIGARSPIGEHLLRLTMFLMIVSTSMFLLGRLWQHREVFNSTISTIRIVRIPFTALGPFWIQHSHLFASATIIAVLALLFQRFAHEREERQRLTRRTKVVESLLSR